MVKYECDYILVRHNTHTARPATKATPTAPTSTKLVSTNSIDLCSPV